MQLYHASNQVVEKPRLTNRFATLDFGTGFYTTPNESQAVEFAKKVVARRGHKGSPTVNMYKLNLEQTNSDLIALELEDPDSDWLVFVVDNRNGRNASAGYDLVIGPVANDDVFATIALYEAGLIDKQAAIKGFRVKKLFRQYLFHTEKALDCLTFKTSYIVGDRQ